jgi:hypothetical protein
MQQQQQMMLNMPLIQPPPGQSPMTPQTINNPNIIRNLMQFPGEFSYTHAQRASRL